MFMAPIVAPNICRYSINQTLGGQPVVNVLDMEVISTNPLEDRPQHLFEVAGDILNNWTDHVLSQQVNDLSARSVSWIDLDSLDGTRGDRSSTSAETWPQNGAQAVEAAMPAVVSMRIDKATSGGRGTKSGRMYLAGCGEGWTSPDVTQTWLSSLMASVQASLGNFLNGINNEAGPNGREQALVVVHTREGVYRDHSPVTSLTVNSAISTQVRRGTLR